MDFYGLEAEEVRVSFPSAYQYLLERAKPERDLNRNAVFREKWWVIGHPRQQFRHAVHGLMRYIATLETSKHRFFVFLPSSVTPDSSLVTIADERGETLGVVSSEVHAIWALANGGTLESRPRYNKTSCFETFPFPDLNAADTLGGPLGVALVDEDGNACRTRVYDKYPSEHIDALAEQLDTHRKQQQEAHPGLTLTGMYNVLEKLRAGEDLTAKERIIHEQGLVSVLRQLHDELDEAVLNAYGWADLAPVLRIAHGNDAPARGQTREDAKREFEEAVLGRLVTLNAERAAEEARGHIRWLRPEFQNPEAQSEPEQPGLDTGRDDDAEGVKLPVAAAEKPKQWPKDPVEQVRAVADLLTTSPVSLSLTEIGERFTARGAWKNRLPRILDMLVALGRAQEEEGRFVGS